MRDRERPAQSGHATFTWYGTAVLQPPFVTTLSPDRYHREAESQRAVTGFVFAGSLGPLDMFSPVPRGLRRRATARNWLSGGSIMTGEPGAEGAPHPSTDERAQGQDVPGLGERERDYLLDWVGENLTLVRQSASGQRP